MKYLSPSPALLMPSAQAVAETSHGLRSVPGPECPVDACSPPVGLKVRPVGQRPGRSPSPSVFHSRLVTTVWPHARRQLIPAFKWMAAGVSSNPSA